jgi:periplasmic protein TonB
MNLIFKIFALVLLTTQVTFSQADNLLAKLESEPSSEKKFRGMELPTFVGGQSALIAHVKSKVNYPEIPFKLGIEGTVLVNFRISKGGEILNPYISKGVHPILDEEALRLVKAMPNWIPARQNGIPREVAFQLPIRFALKN